MRELNIPSLEMHQKALKDIGLEFAATSDIVDQVASGSTGAVATMSGTIAAQRTPHELDEHSLEAVLLYFADTYSEAWAISFVVDDNGARLNFADCAIRDICRAAGTELGGSLCALFHGYMTGYLHHLVEGNKRSRFTIEEVGDECRIRIDLI
jgi:hypothetical protein